MENNELSHHGIKGQKWGVRRFQNEDGSLTAEGRKRYENGDSYGLNERDLDMKDRVKFIEEKMPLAKQQVEKDFADPEALAKHRAWLADFHKAYEKWYFYDGGDENEARRLRDIFNTFANDPEADVLDKLADKFVYDNGSERLKSYIDTYGARSKPDAGTKAKNYEEYRKYTCEREAEALVDCYMDAYNTKVIDELNHSELRHWGIKGQRWGVRRFQNEDGSLTAEGRKRYGKGSAETSTETTEEKKARILKSRSAKELYKNADLFTTQELQEAYNRLSLERNIRGLAPAEVSKGEKFMDATINWGKKVSNLVQVGTELYSNMEKVRKMIDGEPKAEAPKLTKYKDRDLSKVSDKELKDIKNRVQTERDIQKFIEEIEKKSYSKDKDD